MTAYLEYTRAHHGAGPPDDWTPSADELAEAESIRNDAATAARSPSVTPRKHYRDQVSRRGLPKLATDFRVAVQDGVWVFKCPRCASPVVWANEHFLQRVLAAVDRGDDTVDVSV